MIKNFFKTHIKRLSVILLTVVSLLATSFVYAEDIKPSASFSLDVKNMDIVEVLKIISEEGGFNIFVGGNVRGRVTFFLDNVNVWDAFEILLLSNGLAYEKKDDVIYVMPDKEFETKFGKEYGDERKIKVFDPKFADVKELKEMISQLLSSIGKVVVNDSTNMLVVIDIPERIDIIEAIVEKSDRPVETEVIKLNYSSALEIGEKISELVTRNVGKIQVDETANKIVITDYSKKIEELRAVITQLDEKPMQVLITAKIIEIQPSKNFYQGVNWDYWLEKYFRVQGDFTIPSPSGASDKFSMGTIGTAAVDEKDDYTGILEFLETFGETKILSSPRIVALNNEEAKILVGTKDVYITSTVSEVGESAVSSQTVNFVDVGVKLFVTPKINDKGYVTLKIKPEISSSQREVIKTDDKETEIPIVTTSEAETSVVVKDGVSIIIGGLRKDTVVKENKRVPVLGRIPGLSLLLSSKKDTWSKNELVILLTPKIISGDKEFELELKEKKDFLQGHTDVNITVEGEPIDDYVDREEFNEVEEEPAEETEEIAQLTSEDKEEKLAYYNVFPEPVVNTSAMLDEYIKTMPVDYNTMLTNKIYDAIEKLVNKEAGSIKVRFTVLNDGKLLGKPTVISDLKNKKLKNQAIDLILRSAPYPKFPETKKENQETYEIELSF